MMMEQFFMAYNNCNKRKHNSISAILVLLVQSLTVFCALVEISQVDAGLSLLDCADQSIQAPCARLPLPAGHPQQQQRNSQLLGIVCSGGQSLQQLLAALEPLHRRCFAANSQQQKPLIELLRIEHTPIPVFSLDSLGFLRTWPIRRLQLRNNSLAQFLLTRPNSSNNNYGSGSDGSNAAFDDNYGLESDGAGILSASSSASIRLLDSLEHLELAHNDVADLAADCPGLAAFRNLRSLVLTANRLAAVPAHTFLRFHSRRSLQHLDLSANWLTDSALSPEALLGLEQLRRLSLDKNRLSRVPTEAIGMLADSLEELYMSANQIDAVEPGDLPPMPRLKSLALDANQISWLAAEALLPVPSLWYLYLGQNQFPAIPPAMLAFVPELKVLAMAGNPMERVEAATFQLAPSLLRLDLSQCGIRHFDEETFEPVPRLQFLNLAGNRLDVLPNGLLAGKFPFLVALDLSHNGLQSLGTRAFAGLGQLEALDLRGNKLSSLGNSNKDGPDELFRETFPSGSSAHPKLLDLSDNPLDCSQERIAWLRALRGRAVRIAGTCAEPAQLRGTALAKLLIADHGHDLLDPKELREREAVSNGNGQQLLTLATTTSTPSFTTTIAISSSSNLLPSSSSSSRRRVGNEGADKTSAAINSKKNRQKQQPSATSATANQSQSDNNESNAAVLVLVCVLTGVGLFLTACLLAVAMWRHQQTTLVVSAADGQRGISKGGSWLRLKFFGPSKSKSFSPPHSLSASSSPAVDELNNRNCLPPPAALLTTWNLNYHNSKNQNNNLHVPANHRRKQQQQPSAVFYTNNNDGQWQRKQTGGNLPLASSATAEGGGGYRYRGNWHRDRWRVQREIFRF